MDIFPSNVEGFVTDKNTGQPIYSFYITTNTGKIFDSNIPYPYNPYHGTNYYYFPHDAGTIDMFCSCPAGGYKGWKRLEVILNQGRTKFVAIKMTPLL